MHVQPSDALPKIMFARYYGSNLPRFMSPDLVSPIDLQFEDPEEFVAALMEVQGWNRYTYARNNPLYYVDPDGQVATAAAAGAGALGGTRAVAGAAAAGGIAVAAAVVGWGLGEAGALIIEMGVNKDLFTKAEGLAKRIETEITKYPGGFDPEDPKWKQHADRIKAKMKELKELGESITNKAKRGKIEKMLQRLKQKLQEATKKGKGGKENQYGIDPDGPGPAPNPCATLGPLCK